MHGQQNIKTCVFGSNRLKSDQIFCPFSYTSEKMNSRKCVSLSSIYRCQENLWLVQEQVYVSSPSISLVHPKIMRSIEKCFNATCWKPYCKTFCVTFCVQCGLIPWGILRQLLFNLAFEYTSTVIPRLKSDAANEFFGERRFFFCFSDSANEYGFG
jgi:hypothetical protein